MVRGPFAKTLRCDGRPGPCASYWLILPTPHLRALVKRRLTRSNSWFNYCVEWDDTLGYGLHLTHAGWVPPGGFYDCPD